MEVEWLFPEKQQKRNNQTCLVPASKLGWALKHHLHQCGAWSSKDFLSCTVSFPITEDERMMHILTVAGFLLAAAGRATGKDVGVGGVTDISQVGSLATSILTEFPQFLSTWATCSLVIPCTFVPPICKMWSPVCSLPSLNPRKKNFFREINNLTSLVNNNSPDFQFWQSDLTKKTL
jgi:hypothetical protein